MNKICKILSVFFILIMITTTISLAKEQTNDVKIKESKQKIVTSDIFPGFTEQQIKKSHEMGQKIISQIYKNLTKTKSGINEDSASASITGASMYVIRSPIDSIYTINKYYPCDDTYCGRIYPELKVPLKTEVWNDGFKPIANARVIYYLLYWDYEVNNWVNSRTGEKVTNSNGQVNIGFKMPYKYHDSFLLTEIVMYYNGSKWISNVSYRYFRVNWY